MMDRYISAFARPAAPGPTQRLNAAILRAVDQVLLWQERARSRRDLAALDDRMLRDIGVDRATAEREAGQVFWRAADKPDGGSPGYEKRLRR